MRHLLSSFLVLSLLWGVASASIPPQAEPDLQPIPRQGRVTQERGSSNLRKGPATNEWTRLQPNMILQPGDSIEVATGRVEVEFDDKSRVRLWNGTQFSITELSSLPGDEAAKSRFILQSGQAWFHVPPLPSGSFYIVETPALVAQVMEPGAYRVNVAPSGFTEVEVHRGSLKAGAGASVTDVETGTALAALPGDATGQLKALDVRDMDRFDDWALAREERYARQSASAAYVSEEVPFSTYELDENGNWRWDPEYGYVWSPRTVASDWSPYTDGRWKYLEPYGWTWIPAESWGYVPHHYGSWTRSPVYGWTWVPGATWGPAWVSWRHGSASVSWVALHPFDDYHYWNYYNRYVYVGRYPYFSFFFGYYYNYFPVGISVGIGHRYYNSYYHRYPYYHQCYANYHYHYHDVDVNYQNATGRTYIDLPATMVNAPRNVELTTAANTVQRELFNQPSFQVTSNELKTPSQQLASDGWMSSPPEDQLRVVGASFSPETSIVSTSPQLTQTSSSFVDQGQGANQLREVSTQSYRAQLQVQEQRFASGELAQSGSSFATSTATGRTFYRTSDNQVRSFSQPNQSFTSTAFSLPSSQSQSANAFVAPSQQMGSPNRLSSGNVVQPNASNAFAAPSQQVAQPSQQVRQPTQQLSQPQSRQVQQPPRQVQQSTQQVQQPKPRRSTYFYRSPQVRQPSSRVTQPSRRVQQPSSRISQPSRSVRQPFTRVQPRPRISRPSTSSRAVRSQPRKVTKPSASRAVKKSSKIKK